MPAIGEIVSNQDPRVASIEVATSILAALGNAAQTLASDVRLAM